MRGFRHQIDTYAMSVENVLSRPVKETEALNCGVKALNDVDWLQPWAPRCPQMVCFSVCWSKRGVSCVCFHDWSRQGTQLGRSAIRPKTSCEGRALGMGVPKRHVHAIAIQCKGLSFGSTQLQPCVCLGACAIRQARIRTALHTEWLWRRNSVAALVFVRTK